MVALLCASLLSGPLLAHAAAVPPQSGSTKPAEVNFGSTSRVGRFDTAIVAINQRCRAGALVAELVVDVAQPSVSGSRAGTFGATCDGAWHAVSVEVPSTTGDPFVAGAAYVTARFTVLDPDSMDPLPQGTAAGRVTLLPTAEVRIGQEAHVGQFDTIVVPVVYRCQRPWLVSQLSVDVTQGDLNGVAFRHDGLRCDARWHRLEVGLSSNTGAPFERGFADISVLMNIEDPVDFDPVEQAGADAQTWVSPAARIVIASATLRRDRQVSSVVAARCHRPYIVAGWGVSVTQRDGRIGGSVNPQTGLTCDAGWHRVTVVVPGRFFAGAAVSTAYLDIQDPVQFDPVDQATDRRTFTLTAPTS